MATGSDRVRVGVVGMGAFGQLHATTLAALAEFELAALVNRSPGRLREAAALPGLAAVPAFTDLAEALRVTGVKAWIVASATSTHVPFGRELLEAGCTVLMEKPLADRLDEAEQLAPLIVGESANLMMGHIVLFNSEFLALQAEARKRGRIVHIACTRQRGMDHRTRFPGESPFHLTMTHDLYCVQMLVECREPVAVTGWCHEHAEGGLDLALGQLRWEDGAIATLSAGFLLPAGAGDQGFDRMEVFGTDWAARIQTNPRPLVVWDDARATHLMHLEIGLHPQQPTGMLAEQLRCFARVVRGQRTPPVGTRFQDALQITRWLDALAADARAALRRGPSSC